MKRFELADEDDNGDLDFLEQEINNVGAFSANKVIEKRNLAAKRPPKPPVSNDDAGLDDLADLEDLMEGGE